VDTLKKYGLPALSAFAVLMVGVSLLMVFLYPEAERTMGDVQRIFYYHMASSWVGAAAFGVTLAGSVLYLVRRAPLADRIAHASVEVGMTITAMGVFSGPFWAKAVWGEWWPWEDPRLITSAIMMLTYGAYLMLRQGITESGQRRRYASVYGIIAFASVIMTFVVTRISASIHPVLEGGIGGLPPRMLQTLMFCALTLLIVYITLLWHRVRLARLSERVEMLKLRYYEEEDDVR
jgi:heme exporter protein C